MNRKQLIKKYLEFFQSKDHKVIANSSLIPENDPTVLFTTAGMHPLIPFLIGQKHPQGKRLVNVQRCIRTGDIEEVGDSTHHTFFEMLGNWSLGDYGKKEAIEMSFEFLTKILKIPKEKLAVTIFAGDKDKVSADFDSKNIWEKLGVKKITPLGWEDNWWGPVGNTGPCGPDTEMFYWRSKKAVPAKFNPNRSTLATEGRDWEEEKQDWEEESHNWVEIWNDVFMEYEKTKDGKFKEAKQKNIDTGMGVERVLAILNNLEDNYLTECFKPLIEKIEKLSGKKYEQNQREMRIIADHIKASVFIIADGIVPSNTEQGYVLRRLIRVAIRNLKKLEVDLSKTNIIEKIAKKVFGIYDDYKLNKKQILEELKKEEEKFLITLEKGLRELKKMAWKINIKEKINGKNAFLLFQSYGFPIEITKELAMEWGADVDEEGFTQELAKHQKLSRTATAGKFKSGLADNSEQTTKLHTAAHLLLAALRTILKNNEIIQKGSNITAERLRLDFSFPKKLSEKELKDVEDLVNAQIQKSCEVVREEMSPEQAKNKGALGAFEKKYNEKVSVYSVGNFSKEICAGPHVKNTSELGKFKIIKEESSSSGVRRIRGVLG